jgi:membrane protein
VSGVLDPAGRSASHGHHPAVRVLATVFGLRIARSVVSLTAAFLTRAWHHRVLGLSAEAGFWQLLSLPSAVLGILGTVGYFRGVLGPGYVDRIENRLLHASGRVLTPDTVENTIKPTLDAVLNGGRADLISLGFLLSFWSGSSAMATFVNTITIAYDQRELRSAFRSRMLALALYLGAITAGTLILAGLVIGPAKVARIPFVAHHPTLHDWVHVTYSPLLVVLALAAVATLYHLAVPIRPRWRHTLPGAILAAVVWALGAAGLRSYVSYVFRRTLDYGALASPVAVLLFFYVTALAVLLGAELNAELDRRRHARAARVATSKDEVGDTPGTGESRPAGDSDAA